MNIDDLKPKSEYISPEGVEERVLYNLTGWVTITQGGKYRVYCNINGETMPPKLVDTEERAEKAMYHNTAIMATFTADPERTLKEILEHLERKDND